MQCVSRRLALPQEREIASLAQQISYSYSSNRRAPPSDLHTEIPKIVLHRSPPPRAPPHILHSRPRSRLRLPVSCARNDTRIPLSFCRIPLCSLCSHPTCVYAAVWVHTARCHPPSLTSRRLHHVGAPRSSERKKESISHSPKGARAPFFSSSGRCFSR